MFVTSVHFCSCTDTYKYSFFPRTIHDWNCLDTLSQSELIHSLHLTFPATNTMHPSGNALNLSASLGKRKKDKTLRRDEFRYPSALK